MGIDVSGSQSRHFAGCGSFALTQPAGIAPSADLCSNIAATPWNVPASPLLFGRRPSKFVRVPRFRGQRTITVITGLIKAEKKARTLTGPAFSAS